MARAPLPASGYLNMVRRHWLKVMIPVLYVSMCDNYSNSERATPGLFTPTGTHRP